MRLKRQRGAASSAPQPIYSLSAEQASWLRDAADKAPRGAYVPVTGGRVATELVQGGAAEYREEHQSSGTRGVHDARPCQWTDLYLVPTQYGLELLRRATKGA